MVAELVRRGKLVVMHKWKGHKAQCTRYSRRHLGRVSGKASLGRSISRVEGC